MPKQPSLAKRPLPSSLAGDAGTAGYKGMPRTRRSNVALPPATNPTWWAICGLAEPIDNQEDRDAPRVLLIHFYRADGWRLQDAKCFIVHTRGKLRRVRRFISSYALRLPVYAPQPEFTRAKFHLPLICQFPAPTSGRILKQEGRNYARSAH